MAFVIRNLLVRVGVVSASVAWVFERCPADFKGDGVVNALNVLAFLNAWTTGCD